MTGPALSLAGIGVSLGGRAVLRDVGFDLAPGMFCGLIGANGSGKTTLLRAILGLVPTDAGRIAFGAEGRRAVGYVPQKILLDPFMPLRARDVVTLGIDGNRLGLRLPSAARRARVDEALASVDAVGFADRRVGDLSGGQQQRVMIAHALVRRPRLLLLDEPLASLDLRSVTEVVALLRRLADGDIAVLLSAHDMNPLLPAMEHIVYLAGGKAVDGTVAEVVRGSVLSRLYGHHIDVIRVHGRVLVVAAGETVMNENGEPAHVAEIR